MRRYSSLRRRAFVPAVTGLVLLGFAAAGCASVATPKGWASPVLSDDLLLLSHRDDLLAVDPNDLSPRWTFPSEENDADPVALYGTPAAAGGTVFVPTYEGKLYALNAATGSSAWQAVDTGGPLIGGVLATAETVYFASSDGKVYALDAASGQQRWSFKTDDSVWSTPALVGDTLLVTSLDGRLYALDAELGTERWSFKTAAGVASPPVVNQGAGLIYVAGFDSRLRAIDLETHQQRWSVNADNWFWTRPLLSDGTLYAGSLDGRVYAVDAETGASRWPRSFSAGAPVRSAPVLAGDALLVVDTDGMVYRIGAAGGTADREALDLGADVLVDPLLVEADAGGALVLIVVTTDEELVRIDAETLTVLDRRALG